MKTNRRLKFTFAAILAAFVAALLAVIIMLTGVSVVEASAADRLITLDGSAVFVSDNLRGAEVGCYDGEDNHHYLQFAIGKDQTVSYRQHLAYSWKVGAVDEDGKYNGKSEDRRFNMEFGFANTDFEKFIIRFQSQQYIHAENNITENFLVFTVSEGKIFLAVKKDVDEDITPVELCSVGDKVKIEFGEFKEGVYPLIISVNGNAVDCSFSFVNVFETYSEYTTTSDKAVTPLRFYAEFADDKQTDIAKLVMYSMNGQSFELYEDKNKGVYDTAKDTTPPVMCFKTTPSLLECDKKISFEYQPIDVLASNVRTTVYYYVLTGDQFGDPDYNFDKTNEEWEDDIKSAGEGEKPVNPYLNVTSTNSTTRIVRNEKTFIPSKFINAEGDMKVLGLVKMYFLVSDSYVTDPQALKDTIYVEWYAKPDALVNIYEIKEGADTQKTSNFIKLTQKNEDKTVESKGVTLASKKDLNAGLTYEQTVERIQASYQKKIDEAISALKDKDTEDGSNDGKLFAGGKNRFYLPSIEDDFIDCSFDDYFYARDYKYSIYFQTSGGAKNSNTDNDYNKLSISLNEANVDYYFRIYIEDSFGNPMRYPVTDGEGNITEWVEITKSEIWDEKYDGLLPEFTFPVYYKPATVEAPEDLSLAYVDTAYSGVSFKISGVSDTYKTSYDLFIFDKNAMYDKTQKALTYEEFVKNVDALYANTYDESVDTRSFFVSVKPANSLIETDANYELFKGVNWNATGISFVPKSVDDFYVVRLTLTDTVTNVSEMKYAVVSPSVQTTALPGESDWVKDNITSIILLSVAGACLIALLILLIVKPKDKGDIDAIYNEVEEKSSQKKSKKKA